jgi:hypothetical protein
VLDLNNGGRKKNLNCLLHSHPFKERMSYEDTRGVLRVVAARNREVTHRRWLIARVGLRVELFICGGGKLKIRPPCEVSGEVVLTARKGTSAHIH